MLKAKAILKYESGDSEVKTLQLSNEEPRVRVNREELDSNSLASAKFFSYWCMTAFKDALEALGIEVIQTLAKKGATK